MFLNCFISSFDLIRMYGYTSPFNMEWKSNAGVVSNERFHVSSVDQQVHSNFIGKMTFLLQHSNNIKFIKSNKRTMIHSEMLKSKTTVSIHTTINISTKLSTINQLYMFVQQVFVLSESYPHFQSKKSHRYQLS